MNFIKSLNKLQLSGIASLILLLVALIVIYSGAYNVAANDKHFDITTSILEVVRNKSIEARSSDIKVPPLNSDEMVKQGAGLYSEMCSTCHLAPGLTETELNSGLYPKPPVFTKADYSNKPSSQFWVIKNGLKMTGMPAWSPPHTDNQVWSMVAFINKSKQITSTEYQAMIEGAGGGHHAPGQGHGSTSAHSDAPENAHTTEPVDSHDNSDGHGH